MRAGAASPDLDELMTEPAIEEVEMKIVEKLKSVFQSRAGKHAEPKSRLLCNMAQNKVVLYALAGLALAVLVILSS